MQARRPSGAMNEGPAPHSRRSFRRLAIIASRVLRAGSLDVYTRDEQGWKLMASVGAAPSEHRGPPGSDEHETRIVIDSQNESGSIRVSMVGVGGPQRHWTRNDLVLATQLLDWFVGSDRRD